MAKESIETIMAKYNRLCARFRDLEQQTTEKQQKWKELEREFKINESLTRELCELILAKDPGEMRLGTEYSWSKLKTRDIILRSKGAFATYNETRTALLKDIQSQSEERRMMIESLKTQLEQDKRAKQQLEDLRAERDRAAAVEYDAVTGEVVDPADAPVSDDTKKRVAYKTQQAAEEGGIDLLSYDEDEDLSSAARASDGKPAITDADISRGKRTPVTPSLSIWEEKKDVTAADVEQQGDMAKRSATLSLERGGRQITQTQKKVDAANKQRQSVIASTVQVSLGDIEKRMTDRHWKMLEVVGSTGVCEGGEIITACVDATLRDGVSSPPTESGYKYVLMNMVSYGCFTMDNTIKHPMKSNYSIYTLSDIGRSIYVKKFNADPVVSERDVLIADHDNMEHALGIKCLKQILEESGMYTDVSMSRAANTIRLDDGTFYIPDIVAQGKTRQKKSFRAYMEYERDTHHQADFNIKLNKAVKVSRYVDIVCQNSAIADSLKNKVAKWIESRGGNKMLPNVRVRITPLPRLNKKKNINDDDNWQVVFQLRNSAEPIERR